MAAGSSTMTIDVWADIVCPWCYIGERRLAAALAQRPDITATIRWMPFQLQPDLPSDGLPWEEFVTNKFGGAGQAQAIFARVAEAGAPEGIAFHFERITRSPNTTDAHRLLLFAQDHGRTEAAAETLFAAYFTEGRDIGDRDTLVELATRVELDATEARDWLESGASTFEVEQAQRLARGMGVTSVPLYIFDGRYALSGAQPVDEFLQTLDAAATPVEPGTWER